MIKIYCTNSSPCKDILKQIDISADVSLEIVKPRFESIGSKVSRYIVEGKEYKTLPILTHGETVKVGFEILTYLMNITPHFLVKINRR